MAGSPVTSFGGPWVSSLLAGTKLSVRVMDQCLAADESALNATRANGTASRSWSTS